MNHSCRDCGERILGPDKLNRCPVCNSMYLIPHGDSENQTSPSSKSSQYGSYNQLNDIPGLGRKITLGERWWCALLGFLFGCLTFFIWLIEISIAAVMFDGMSAFESFETGITLSVLIGVVLGIIGFAIGADRFAAYMGLLWGTGDHSNADHSGGGLFAGLIRLIRIAVLAGGVILFIYYLGVRG